jgi:hypothetical protein
MTGSFRLPSAHVESMLGAAGPGSAMHRQERLTHGRMKELMSPTRRSLQGVPRTSSLGNTTVERVEEIHGASRTLP